MMEKTRRLRAPGLVPGRAEHSTDAAADAVVGATGQGARANQRTGHHPSEMMSTPTLRELLALPEKGRSIRRVLCRRCCDVRLRVGPDRPERQRMPVAKHADIYDKELHGLACYPVRLRYASTVMKAWSCRMSLWPHVPAAVCTTMNRVRRQQVGHIAGGFGHDPELVRTSMPPVDELCGVGRVRSDRGVGLVKFGTLAPPLCTTR